MQRKLTGEQKKNCTDCVTIFRFSEYDDDDDDEWWNERDCVDFDGSGTSNIVV